MGTARDGINPKSISRVKMRLDPIAPCRPFPAIDLTVDHIRHDVLVTDTKVAVIDCPLEELQDGPRAIPVDRVGPMLSAKAQSLAWLAIRRRGSTAIRADRRSQPPEGSPLSCLFTLAIRSTRRKLSA